MTHIEVDLGLCTGCRVCEQVCAFAHEHVFGPGRSRIRILRKDVLEFEAKVCTHCVEIYCVKVCPTEALIRIGNKTELIAEECIGCAECVEVCDLLFWDPQKDLPLICDLCEECVIRCPEEAIRLVKDNSEEIEE